MTAEPAATIIISAYNRPKVLVFSIKSVLASDFQDWELIVVGDGCNEETERAARSFDDPRIRFINLPANTGSQSEPHNVGVREARGRFVFFLNQDDMYFPDHIAASIDFMERSGADFAWSPVLLLQHSGSDTGPIDADSDRVTLDGVAAGDRFDPRSFIISSSWVTRRETCLAVGPWLAADKTRLSPSQEWLYRASKQGRRMLYHRHVSVLCIHSGVRRYSYLVADSVEHERAWNWIQAGPPERIRLLNCVAVQKADELWQTQRKQRPSMLRVIDKWLAAAGIHPHAAERFFHGIGKGGFVADHRRFTQQPVQVAIGETVQLGVAAADEHLGRGWHGGEGGGRWSSSGLAEIFFSTPAAAEPGNHTLLLCGHPFRRPDTVAFAVTGTPVLTKVIEDAETIIRLPLAGTGAHRVTIEIASPTSPSKLQRSDDERTLGFWACWMRIERNADEQPVSHPAHVGGA
jgi:glycosyltransferase involved in cell wall biosynthesis